MADERNRNERDSDVSSRVDEDQVRGRADEVDEFDEDSDDMDDEDQDEEDEESGSF